MDGPITINGETVRAIDEIVKRYPVAEAALLPVLHKVQDQLGWLPVSALDWVAKRLGLPKTRVYGVTSFYTMFKRQKPGKHRIEICTNISCSLLGAEHLRDHIAKKLNIKPGETTEDGRITFDEVECLGSCGTAPVMLVDDKFYEKLTPEKVDDVLDKLNKDDLEAGGND
ncbi:MAG: NADH-quinone oxidoreductase subunit NuoE [Deltaproteobacteria bacterium]|nr:NADH-quinone oxidoreductase subunit NuoE [Deltaproteobacteria bacterium]